VKINCYKIKFSDPHQVGEDLREQNWQFMEFLRNQLGRAGWVWNKKQTKLFIAPHWMKTVKAGYLRIYEKPLRYSILYRKITVRDLR